MITNALNGTKLDSYSEREADWDYEEIPILASVVRRVDSMLPEGALTKDDLTRATESALQAHGSGSAGHAQRIVQKMHNTGLFWQPPKQAFLSVGLPSFASYLVDRAQARESSTLLE